MGHTPSHLSVTRVPRTSNTESTAGASVRSRIGKTVAIDAASVSAPYAIDYRDAFRMTRLVEEVSGRVHEKALILARTLGVEHFKPETMTFQVQAGEPEFERHCDGQGRCVCYDYVRKVCYMC